jgi:hypothetical protein
MSPEERNRERRERYKRKKEWQATLDRYAEFAAYIVNRKREEKERR